MQDKLRLLVLGATGVFGSRLVERLAREQGFSLTLAARNLDRVEALAARCCPLAHCRVLERDKITVADLAGIDIVIDAAGPFQMSHSKVIDAAIATGVHYIDLADGRDFIAGITEHDAPAKAAGIAVIAGVSSIPALSHAVIDELTAGWQRLDTIRIGIFPGNRAPRGLSVAQAILSYAGRPVRVFMGGGWHIVPGWGLTHRWRLTDQTVRWASVCDTPEQDLLVARYRPTHSAEFFAGLELSWLHIGLAALTLPVRWGLLPSLRPLARPLLWLAQRFLPFGSDMGYMEVKVAGVDHGGSPADRCWTLRASGNRGPFVPVLAVLALLRQWRDDGPPEAGARACSGMLHYGQFKADLAALDVACWVS